MELVDLFRPIGGRDSRLLVQCRTFVAWTALRKSLRQAH